jgi:hypothetical protein
MNQNEATEFLKNYQIFAALRTAMRTRLRSDEMDRAFADLNRDDSVTPKEFEEARKAREAWGNETDQIRLAADLLISMLPVNLGAQLQSIPVGTLPDLKLNAETLKSPSGDPIIVVATGLSAMLFEVAAWYAGATEIRGEPPEVEIRDATRNVFQWVVFYVTRSKEWIPKGIFRSKVPIRRNLIGGLWTNALNFVLGHEYGHAILGHLDHPDSKTLNISNIDTAPLLAYDFSHKMEHEADAKGAEIALAFSQSNHNGWIGAGASGTELVLQLLWLTEELFPQRAARSTHPSPEERLNHFHESLRDRYGDGIVDGLHDLASYFDMTATIGKQVLRRNA